MIGEKDVSENENERTTENRGLTKRDLIKGAAATVAASAVAMTTSQTKADNPVEAASRYVPPGQWWQHFDVEWWEFPSDDPGAVEVWAYTNKLSYAPGETVSFHVNSSAPTFDVTIYRDGLKLEEVHATTGIAGEWSETPNNCFTFGCNWPVLHMFKLSNNLRSGVYLAIFSFMRGEERVEHEAGFIVRAAQPTAPIVFMLSTQTWMAYNDWGGGNHYGKPGGGSSTGVELGFIPRLHIHRPWARGFMRLPKGNPRANDIRYRTREAGARAHYLNFEWSMANGYSKWCTAAGWPQMERHTAIWCERNGYELDYIAQQDLAANPEILNDYKCLLTSGHDEYYTWGQRDSIDAFMENGGRFARFGGNINWQSRLEEDGNVLVTYKSNAETDDPLKDERIRTGSWVHPKTNRNSATTFGVDSMFGHLVGIPAAAPRTPGFITLRPDHWMLKDSDLYYGDAFGSIAAGYECDGLPITFRDGLAYPIDEFGTPTNIEIVAILFARAGEEKRDHTPRVFADEAYLKSTPQGFYGKRDVSDEQVAKHTHGNGLIAYMPKGKGGVATGPTVDWCYALGRDEFIDKITQNVLDRFTA